MPASSRPFRSALIRDEGSTRSAPPSFVIAGSLGLAALLAWRDLRHAGRNPALASYCLATGFVVVILFTASLLAPSFASPGLLERLALLAGSAWVVVYAQQLRRTLSVNRHEFERNLVAA